MFECVLRVGEPALTSKRHLSTSKLCFMTQTLLVTTEICDYQNKITR